MSSIDASISGLLAVQQTELHSAIGFAVAAKALDAQEQQGDAAVKLLEQAARLSKAIGKGENFDSQA